MMGLLLQRFAIPDFCEQPDQKGFKGVVERMPEGLDRRGPPFSWRPSGCLQVKKVPSWNPV